MYVIDGHVTGIWRGSHNGYLMIQEETGVRIDSNGSLRTILLAFKRKTYRARKLLRKREEWPWWLSQAGVEGGHMTAGKPHSGEAVCFREWLKPQVLGKACLEQRFKKTKMKSRTLLSNAEKQAGLQPEWLSTVRDCARGGEPSKERYSISSNG